MLARTRGFSGSVNLFVSVRLCSDDPCCHGNEHFEISTENSPFFVVRKLPPSGNWGRQRQTPHDSDHAECLSDRPYVCPSVRLSVTLVHCVHTVRPMTMISAPYGSPIILVSGDIKLIPKFEGDHPERGHWMRVGWVRIGDFRPISRRIVEGYYWSLIGNWIRPFDWYQNQRPWLTLKWPWTEIMHSVVLHTCFGANH